MNPIDDPNLICPAAIKPEYSQKDSRFFFRVPLLNKHPHCMHFYIASTFGCCLEETTNIRRVEPNQQIMLCFRMKLTNLLGGGVESVVIYGSNHKGQEQFPHIGGSVKLVRLDFNEDNKIDPTIFEILENEVNFCMTQAEKLKQEGQPVKALNKYEQAYEIMRSSQRVIDQMIAIRLDLNEHKQAIRDLQAVLINKPNDPHFLLLKLKTIFLWAQAEISQNQELFHYIRTSLQLVKEKLYTLQEQDNKIYTELEGKFIQYQKITTKEPNKLMEGLYQNAVDSYNQDLNKFFISKQKFSQQLRELLFSTKHEDIATPEEVLDPINYKEIMKKPLILPSGNSVEQSSLQSYFKSNGFRDPISRKEAHNDLVFPNNALEEYIRSHSKLKIWEQYEYDFIHN